MSISSADFASGCQKLHHAWQNIDLATGWHKVQFVPATQYGLDCLRIMRKVPSTQESKLSVSENEAEAGAETEAEVNEQDTEALVSDTPKSDGETQEIWYDIIHSPTYQVPVLYVHLKTTASSLPSLNEITALFVPQSQRTALQAFGTMGALSMTDHPITGLPVWFVHPCRTAEAMESMMDGEKEVLRPEEYLLMWFGLAGASVGVDVPVALAEALGRSERSD